VRTSFALTAVLVLASAVPASAAASSWKTVLITDKAGHESFYAFAAASARDAWVLGDRAGTRRTEPIAYHWNGRRWRPSALPSGTGGFGDGSGENVRTVLSASGRRNAWAVAPGEFREGPTGGVVTECGERVESIGKTKVIRTSRLLRWNGSRWKSSLVLKDAVVTTVVAVGEKKAWAFGEDLKGPITLHYNGTKWSRKRGPVRVDDAKARKSAIWAVGESAATGQPGVWRFDGTRWLLRPYGRLHPKNAPPTKKAEGHRTMFSSLAVLPGGKIAVSGSFHTYPACPGGETELSAYQLLWSGGSWKRDRASKGWQLTEQTSDGRGGRYAIGLKVFSPLDSAPTIRAVFHRTASGRWVGRKFPGGDPVTVFRVPGTRVVYAAGSVESTYDGDGIVARTAG